MWTSVKDRLPESCDRYVVAYAAFTGQYPGEWVDVADWDGTTWRDNEGDSFTIYGFQVTHWTRLPEPPSDIKS